MIIVEIVNGPIFPFPSTDDRQQDGAELIFKGRVRATEHGKNIISLEYEQYEGMAEAELTSLAKEVCENFSINDILCRHRIGIVNVGETSLQVSIWSKHRRGGLDALDYFITELKKRVPIWKWAILIDRSRIPSKCDH